ncbi:MAG: carboxypeptidase-like regulatory domain-containing protein [Salinivirgaceae bacterium]|jgi:hypothetical protein|nr:carboxypeptidase-like regulatory domain-containing protein [Salinivirgaceae bacterium]
MLKKKLKTQYYNKRIFVLLLFLFVSGQLLNAQNTNKLEGIIYNSSDSTYLAYVNIFIRSNTSGTISNEQGAFSFFFKSDNTSDTVVFSAIGYETQKYCISGLNNKELTIYLQPAIIPLEEVVITPLNSKEIVKEALSKMEQNYSQNASILHSYTRQIVEENNKYTRFAEAALDIYNPTYFSNKRKPQKQNLIRLRNSKASLDKTHELIKYKINTADFVANIFINQTLSFLEDLNNYEFSFIEQINYDDLLLYEIKFTSINDKNSSDYDGVIYIDQETKAFVSLQYKYKYDYIKQVKAYINGFVKVNYEYLDYNFRIDFKKVSDKWHLSYMRKGYNIDIYTEDKSIINLKVHAFNDLLVNKTQLDDVSTFKGSELINYKKDIYYQIGTYGNEIWKNFNRIEPPKFLNK